MKTILQKILKNLTALSGFKLSIICTLFMMGLYAINSDNKTGDSFLNLMDKKWVDFIQKGRGTVEHSSDVVIVTVDSKAVDMYGRWPWPRARMAQMVDALNEYGVAVVGFDIVFSEPEQAGAQNAVASNLKKFKEMGLGGGRGAAYERYLQQLQVDLDGDSKLGRALGKKPNVVLGYFFNNDPAGTHHLTAAQKQETESRIEGSEVTFVEGEIPKRFVNEGLVVEANIEKIVLGGTLAGYFNMIPDPEDGTVRRVHLLFRHNDRLYPSLDLQMIRMYLGNPPIYVSTEKDVGVASIQVGDLFLQPEVDSSILLNYKGPAQTFKHISIYDVIERKTPKVDLEGKLVLVGATEVGIYDLRTAPVSSEYPGVEVHATLLDNIITDSYFRFSVMNQVATLALMLVLGLGAGFVIPRMKHIFGTVVAFGVVGVYLVAHNIMVNQMYSWTSAVYPVVEVLLIWGVIILYQFLVSDRDKRFIKGAFQQYLSPAVIDQLVNNPNLLKLGGERRVMTAFFSDVAGFSSFSEKLEPEELVALLNVYLTEMSNIIMKYGGTVDKYEGDAIIAFFGAPIPYEDHAARACNVAIDMQKRLAEMRVQFKAEGRPELTARIGLNTGPMVVGNMGSENRFDYTMMGNAVNLASRLEGANKNYGTVMCVSEMTYEPAKDVIEVRELDKIRVMGISKPVTLYEIMGRKGEVDAQTMQGVSVFQQGLELYRQKKWDAAIQTFQKSLTIIPNDPPSKTFIQRCEEFKATPPPAEWDGVFVASSK